MLRVWRRASGSTLKGQVLGKRLFSWRALLDAGPRHHEEERVVPFESSSMYQVVSDVERYKEFVPYTVDSRILRRINEKEWVAELSVGFGSLHEKYKSRVMCDPARLVVTAKAEDSSLFEMLSTRWEFENRPMDKGSCLLRYRLDFQFRSALHAGVADIFFERVSKSMVAAFLDRCKVLEAARMREKEKEKEREKVVQACAAALEAKQEESRRRDQVLLGELETLSHFSLDELARIKARFDSRANELDGIDFNAFRRLFFELFKDKRYSEEDLNRTASYIFNALDMNKDGALSLREFTAGLSTVVKGTEEERCRFWFRCFDLDADGLVDRDELYEMIFSSIAVRNALLESGVANEATTRNFRIEKNIGRLAAQAVDRCFPTPRWAWWRWREPKVDMKYLMDKKII